ncbi:MAG: hypothetical protein WCY28_01250 [Candidatus Shapirobacteria bacterium]|jgi:hypothetical protein
MENINQIPNLQPIQPVEPIKNPNVFKYLFFISIFVLLGVIIGFYYILNNKIAKLSEEKTSEVVTTQENIQPTVKPTINQESTLTSLNTNNNLYTNKLGFSLTLPKIISIPICQKNEGSYGLGGNEEVSLNLFEKGDTIYFAGEYFYNVTGGENTPEGNFIWTGCQKTTNTFEEINKGNFPSSRMKIYVTNIKDDSELEQFIKSKYGSGCQLGEKTQSTTTGTFDVKILSDGKGLDESLCPINFAIKTKYNQNKGKLVIFELGQACNFYNETNKNCDDLDIVNSLKFN